MTEARGQLLVDAVLTFAGQAFRVCREISCVNGSGMTEAGARFCVDALLTFGGQAVRSVGEINWLSVTWDLG